MIPEQITQELDELNKDGIVITAEAKDDGFIHLLSDAYPLPSGYNKKLTKLLIKLPKSYPNGKPDMFWADLDLELSSGPFKEGISIENIYGVQWKRFSWHLKHWNPGHDSLKTYLEFINRGLEAFKK
ncbi:MAG: E2/UBC family protein [Methylococcales bacterium]|nr:E2/UBC family protein [Methylococcales bacterium]